MTEDRPELATSPSAQGGAPRGRALGLGTGASRVWLLSASLGAAAILLAQVVVPPALPVQPPVTIPWPLLAAAFFVVEANVIHLHIGRSAHSFSMSELPMVAGLVLVAPPEFVIARVIGSGLALAIRRKQSPVKLAFNISQFALGGVASVAIVHVLAQGDPGLGPGMVAGIFVAALAENVLGIVAISAAMSLSEGKAQFHRVPEMLKIGLIVSATNTSIALMAVTVLWVNPPMAALFVIPSVTAGLAYRAYIGERQQHESVELLFESTRILQRSPQLDNAIVALLEHARKMFRADVAEVYLVPRREGDAVLHCWVGPGSSVGVMQPTGPVINDPDMIRAISERRAMLVERTRGELPANGVRHQPLALVAPLLGESNLIGTFLVADRLSDISAFEADDLKLFEALANHTAVALENGQLEQSLEQLSKLKEELNRQALHDPLTGLANRSLFAQVVASRLESPDSNGAVPVVMFVDLDDFKVVNDTLGHAVGDSLLIAVGDRLQSVLRSTDLASRLGGDEFAVVLWDEPDLRSSIRIAQRLTSSLGPMFVLNGREVAVKASIGVAAGRPGVDTASDLLRNADVAMYSAKARGKARMVVFEASMHEAVLARARLSADMEQAISAHEFVLQYQPIVEMRTGCVIGVEALVRWDHPERGRIGPDDFIRAAEESDAILEIGRWVLSEACSQLRTWRLTHSGPFSVSVNVASKQLVQPDFVDEVLAIIRESGVDPAEIVLEMTETSMMRDVDGTRAKLQELRSAGLGISVDDFGTGYSSLSYLQRLPVTTIKIARDFVNVATADKDAWELAKSIIALGRVLGLQVIAEGVEQRSQRARLLALGCELAQGFYFARPLDSAAVEALLAQGALLSGAERSSTSTPGSGGNLAPANHAPPRRRGQRARQPGATVPGS